MATTTARGRATKKRRAPKEKKEQDSPKLLGTGQMQNEAGAVLLGCVGLLTLLALASYHPGDASLNAGGAEVVRNWIGTAGGYWADLLLQIMGMGAFPFGAGLLIAGWRALSIHFLHPRSPTHLLIQHGSSSNQLHFLTSQSKPQKEVVMVRVQSPTGPPKTAVAPPPHVPTARRQVAVQFLPTVSWPTDAAKEFARHA